jgi:branched-chain amino acid transport system permease protein
VPPPEIGGLSLGPDSSWRGLDGFTPSPVFGFFLLAVIALICLLIANVRRSSIGRQMLAVRSNERAAAAAGVNVTVVKLTAFGLSAFIAGIAGVMYSYQAGGVNATRFGAWAALGLIAIAYVGGVTMISGAFFAGMIATYALMPYALDHWFGLSGVWALLFAGLALVVTLILNPEGIAGANYKKAQQRRARKARAATPVPETTPST